MQGVEQRIDFAVIDYRQDSRTHTWPGMASEMRIDPTTGEPVKRSGRAGLTRSSKDEIIRVPSVPLKRPAGTFGSLIYNKPEVENLY